LAGLSLVPYSSKIRRLNVTDNPNAKQQADAKEAATKKLAEQKAAREAAVKNAPPEGKPTPTQEENDQAALGVHVIEKEPDGSPEEGVGAQTKHGHTTKVSEPGKPAGGGYQTRTSRPAENA
jgi:hypothetical protein